MTRWAVVLAAVLAWTGVAAGELPAAVYDRASQRMPDRRAALVLNATISPHWRTGAGEGFTYRRELGEGRGVFLYVEARTGVSRPAFDAGLVSEGLRRAGLEAAAERLPFLDYEQAKPDAIAFSVQGRLWTCSTIEPACGSAPLPPVDPLTVLSPDGRWAAFVKDFNLWVEPVGGGAPFALTRDGALHDAYAGEADSSFGVRERRMRGLPDPPVLLWSPDSRRLFVQRIDERKVREVSEVQSNPLGDAGRPKTLSWRYAYAGDPAIPVGESWVFDVAARAGVRAAVPATPAFDATLIQAKRTRWSPDGATLYVLASSRYAKTLTLYAVDARTGAARTVIAEAGATFVEPAATGQRPMVYQLGDGDLIWFSARDGWARLYLCDGKTGAVKRALTEGPWAVRSVVRLDEAKRLIFVEGGGREPGDDPYDRKLYRIDLDTGRATLLTPEAADHEITAPQQSLYEPPTAPGGDPAAHWGMSPSGAYFLDTYTRADLPPHTMLRHSDGRLVAEIEHADVSRVLAGGLTPPERFTALAADGKTPLYGVLLRPAAFDPDKRYPVIDAIYPGPHIVRVRHGFLDLVFDAEGQNLAELGAIVMLVDGRGTPGRSKTFQDASYGPLYQTGHIDDHIAVLKALGARYPQMDLGRVAIYGSSSGGYASLYGFFTHPEVFKLAVADAEHDSTTGLAGFVETYGGPLTPQQLDEVSVVTLAPNMHGKLLLTQGGRDYVVLPDQPLRVADALEKANKDFELVIEPSAGHAPLSGRTYSTRRAWDFLVRNLIGAEPPRDYDLSKLPAP